MSSNRFICALSRAAAIACLTLTPLLSSHASSTDELRQVHQMRLSMQKSLSDFYMFNGMEGDQRYAKRINDSISAVQEQLSALSNLPSASKQPQLNDLKQHWQLYQSNLQSLLQAMHTQGYTDLQPIADLTESNQQLMTLAQQLYTAIAQDSSAPLAPLTEQVRKQSLLMQDIAMNYASRSASIGGTFFGGTQEQPLDEQVREFSERFETLNDTPAAIPGVDQELNAIATKWRYIEKSLLNYNEKSIPFLVSKYSDSIIEGLEGVASQYAAQQL